MTRHSLKIYPGFFVPLKFGEKTFELRYDDRGYQIGDILNLREWSEKEGGYSGREIEFEVTYILSDFGLLKGFVVMSLRPLSDVTPPKDDVYVRGEVWVDSL